MHLFLFILFFSLFVLSIVATVQFSAGQCLTLDASLDARLVNPCVGVVDYPFYVPEGVTLDDLQYKVNRELNNTLLLQMSTTCVSHVISFHCASIYLKCVPNVNLTNEATYEYTTYSELHPTQTFGLPFQRPCVEVCNDVKLTCSNLYLKVFGVPICTIKQDFSDGVITAVIPTFWDQTNLTSQCFVPQLAPVAQMSEEYDYTASNAICGGFVSNFIVPFATKLNSNFTIFQPPGVVQELLNMELSEGFASVPGFVPTPCYKALIQFQCYSIFIKPVQQSMKQALINGGLTVAQATTVVNSAHIAPLQLASTYITIPEFPPQSVCENYADQCAELLPALVEQNPSLAPNCSALVPDTLFGTHMFPTENQTVSAIVFLTGLTSPNPPELTFQFVTGPNPSPYHNESQESETVSSYSPTCPKGFVIPDHPDHANNVDITGTACAMSCISPIWDTDEWNSFRNSQIVFPIVGVACGVGFLIFIIITQDIKDVYLLVLFTILSLIASVDSILVSNESYEAAFCYDNSIPKMQHPDQSGSDSTSCAIQGAILVYTYFACCCCIVMLTLDWRLKYYPTIYTKIQEKYKLIYYIVQFLCCVVFSLIPMIYSFVNKLLGFSRTQPWCYIRSYPQGPNNIDSAVMGIPVVILVGIYLILFCWNDFFGLFAPTSNAPQNKKEAHSKAAHFAISMTILITFVIYVPYIIARGILYESKTDYLDSLTDWTKCVFQNYDANTPDSCFDVCGEHSVNRPLAAIVPAQVYCLTGNMLLIAPAYILSYLCALLYNTTVRKYVPIHAEGQVIELPVYKVDETRVVNVDQNVVAVERNAVTAEPVEEDKANVVQEFSEEENH